MSINSVTLSGNLTRDPELRTTATGYPVLNFGIAVNDRRKNSTTGEWEDYANFVDCSMFGTRAEAVAPFLSKGSHVTLNGKLRYSTWEKDGQKRNKLEVVVDDIDFTGNRRETTTPQPPLSAYQPATIPPAPAVPDTSVYDEDIPF